LRFVEEEEEEELEFTLPRLVGESSREDDAAGRFAPRPRFPPPLPPLRVVTMAAGRRRGRGVRFAFRLSAKGKGTEWKPKPKQKPPWIRVLLFFLLWGENGKMAEPVGF